MHVLDSEGAALCGDKNIDTTVDATVAACIQMWRESHRAKQYALLVRLCDNCRTEMLAREHARREKEKAEATAREAAARTRLQVEVERGSPGRASPESVCNNPTYKRVDEVDGCTWPASRMIVVLHTGRDTLWACRYGVRDDDSDYGQSQHWFEVEEKTVTKTIWEEKKS